MYNMQWLPNLYIQSEALDFIYRIMIFCNINTILFIGISFVFLEFNMHYEHN